jgi:hypothetical protein
MSRILYALLFLAILWPSLTWACRTADEWFQTRHEERTRQRTGALRKRRAF